MAPVAASGRPNVPRSLIAVNLGLLTVVAALAIALWRTKRPTRGEAAVVALPTAEPVPPRATHALSQPPREKPIVLQIDDIEPVLPDRLSTPPPSRSGRHHHHH